jgi:uncharacterized protein GlcG (DUF336 family)
MSPVVVNMEVPLPPQVLDAGGNYVALKREDGAGILRNDIARWGGMYDL